MSHVCKLSPRYKKNPSDELKKSTDLFIFTYIFIYIIFIVLTPCSGYSNSKIWGYLTVSAILTFCLLQVIGI